MNATRSDQHRTETTMPNSSGDESGQPTDPSDPSHAGPLSVDGDELEQLYATELAVVYQAEHQLFEVLPPLSELVSSQKLAAMFLTHHSETETQIRRLERVFQERGCSPATDVTTGLKGLIGEATGIGRHADPGAARDLAVLSAARAVKHYEICRYGTICNYAERLDYREDHEVLSITLEEEHELDAKLNDFAQSVQRSGIGARKSEIGGPRSEVAGKGQTSV
jgi:ferritin-like metal-binding protein YciE